MPYLALIKIAVVFNNININTDGQMTGGTVETDYDADFATGTNAGSLALGKPKTKGNNEPEPTETEPVGESDGAEDSVATTEDGEPSAGGTDPAESSLGGTGTEKGDTSPSETAMADAGGPNPGNGAEATAENAGTANDGSSDASGPEPEGSDGAGDVTIEHNGQFYGHGDVIELAYDRDMERQIFKLNNAPEDSDISWSTHKNMTEASALSAAGEGEGTSLDVREYGNRALEAEWSTKNGRKNRIRIGINVTRNVFEMNQLYASDSKNSKRLAKSGETLYLVKAKGVTSTSDRKRKVNYSLTTKTAPEDISEDDITWNYSDINGTRMYDKGKINTTRILWERDASFTTSVEAGSPTKTEKSIDVVFVDGTPKKLEFMPPAVSHIVKGKLQAIEDNLKVLDRINRALGLDEKTKFKIDPLRISGFTFNEEDEESRLYKLYERGSVTAGVKAELAEVSFTHPVLKVAERTKIFKAGAYLLFKIQVQAQGGVERFKYAEQNSFQGDNPYIKIVGKGCIEAGLRAELLVLKSQIDFDIKGYVEGCLVGDLKYDFKDEKLIGSVYIPPVVLAAHAKIKSKGALKFELVDWRGKIEISEKITLATTQKTNE